MDAAVSNLAFKCNLRRYGLGGTRIFRTVRLVRVFRVLKLGGRFGKIQAGNVLIGPTKGR